VDVADGRILAPQHDVAAVEQRVQVAALTDPEVRLLGGFSGTEAEVRRELIMNGREVARQMEFDLSWIADGLDTRREVRTLQANYGAAIVGPVLKELDRGDSETKYQRAIKITERIVTLGCSKEDDLPYFSARDL